MRKERGFVEKNEFVEFREAVRKLRLKSHRAEPVSSIVVQLPFMIQRSSASFTKDLRRFTTFSSAILSRDRVKEEFASLTAMAQSTRSIDHKIYFMILRFTGVEVEGEDRFEKRGRCVQDCDDSSLSNSLAPAHNEKKMNYDDHLNKTLYLEGMSKSVYTKHKKHHR